MKRILLPAFIVLLFSSCEKNIDFTLNQTNPSLVVDAQIENGRPPLVVLSKSLQYFSKITPEILEKSFVHDADISISNGTLTQYLKEYTLFLGGGYKAYYYSIDSANLSTVFIGEFNKKYDMHIKANGKDYDASTRIPALTKYPDSIWFKAAPVNPDTNKRALMVRTTDPPGLGNYIRYFTKKNSGNYLPGENSVFDDAVIDGTTYSIQVDPGVDGNSSVNYDDNFFTKGDTVTLKVCNIDKPTYTFWSTWEFAKQSIGNPFSQPGKVVGNVSNGALGVFCGYAAWFGTAIAH
jgi:hypothetical protein